MQWESWSAFWHMGGKGFFVWGSYGLTFLLIIIELIAVRYRQRQVVRRLLRLRSLASDTKKTMAASSASPMTPTEKHSETPQ